MAEEFLPLITQTFPLDVQKPAWSLLTSLSQIYTFSYPSMFYLLSVLIPSQGGPFPSVHTPQFTPLAQTLMPHDLKILSLLSPSHLVILHTSHNSPLSTHSLSLCHISCPGLAYIDVTLITYTSLFPFLPFKTCLPFTIFYCLYPSHCVHLALFSDT